MDPFYVGGAAEVSFWLILSLVPFTIVLAQILNVFTLSVKAVTEVLKNYLPYNLFDMILPLLNYTPHSTVTALLILLALWSGSRAVFSLMRITNRAWKGDDDFSGTNIIVAYILKRLLAVLLTLILLITMIFALYILVFGETIVNVLLTYNDVFLGSNLSVSQVWYSVRWIIAYILFFFMVYAIYFILPNAEMSYASLVTKNKLESLKNVTCAWLKNRAHAARKVLPGAFAASVVMMLATWLYTLYLSRFAMKNFDFLYGSLTTIVVMLLWFYIVTYIIITGIQINAAASEWAADCVANTENRQ